MDGKIALLRTDLDVHAEYARWSARDDRRAPQPRLWDGRARLSIFDGALESGAVEVPLGFSPRVDRLADGRWLFVESRSKPGASNARLYSADGEPAGSFPMGDGIAHIRCSADGTIWVGYFDEGICSIQNDDGSWPISTSGIARFAADGTVLWSYAGEHADLPIDDCYALTLDGTTLWTCFYTGFPIVRIAEGTMRHWPNDLAGIEALAIDADHVLLAGGYKLEKGRLALLRLEEDRVSQLGELRFEPPPRGARLVQGRGRTLHIIGQGQWTRLDVATMRDTVRG